MIKKILIPLGDSPDTIQALSNACDLAIALGADLHGLYVEDEEKIRASYVTSFELAYPLGGLERSRDEYGIDTMQGELKREEAASFQIFETFRSRCAVIPKDTERASGIIWQEILEKGKDFDLISMGKTTYADEDFGKLGDIIKRVLHNSPHPVMVSTRNHPIGNNLMVAYDGKEPSMKALGLATYIAKKLNTSLAILTIGEDYEKAEIINTEAINIAIENGVRNPVPVLHGSMVVEDIIAEIKRFNINLLFMGAYGDSSLKTFFTGSTTEKILKKTCLPVILYR